MTSNKLLYFIVLYFILVIKLQEIPEYDQTRNYDDDIFDPLQDLQNIKYMYNYYLEKYSTSNKQLYTISYKYRYNIIISILAVQISKMNICQHGSKFRHYNSPIVEQLF